MRFVYADEADVIIADRFPWMRVRFCANNPYWVFIVVLWFVRLEPTARIFVLAVERFAPTAMAVVFTEVTFVPSACKVDCNAKLGMM